MNCIPVLNQIKQFCAHQTSFNRIMLQHLHTVNLAAPQTPWYFSQSQAWVCMNCQRNTECIVCTEKLSLRLEDCFLKKPLFIVTSGFFFPGTESDAFSCKRWPPCTLRKFDVQFFSWTRIWLKLSLLEWIKKPSASGFHSQSDSFSCFSNTKLQACHPQNNLTHWQTARQSLHVYMTWNDEETSFSLSLDLFCVALSSPHHKKLHRFVCSLTIFDSSEWWCVCVCRGGGVSWLSCLLHWKREKCKYFFYVISAALSNL